MAKHDASAEKFKQDVRRAGFRVSTSETDCRPIADALNCSSSHVKNIICGHNRPGEALLERLDSLIHSVALGEHPAPLSPLNQAEPDPVVAPVIERAEAQNSHPNYWVERVGDQYRVLQLAALCPSHALARAICELLNKETG